MISLDNTDAWASCTCGAKSESVRVQGIGYIDYGKLRDLWNEINIPAEHEINLRKAAPDLLEAAEDVLFGEGPLSMKALKRLDNAVKKARGE